MSSQCIIVGASHAAAQVATSLRQKKWPGGILMIGEEPGLPYQRPPLSKAFMSGEKDAESLAIRPAEYYRQQEIEHLQGTVIAIDRGQKFVVLEDGSQRSYDKLVLCVGARVRRLELPGVRLSGVHYLRTLSDVNGIRAQAGAARKAVIIGGGYIGLEAAASLRGMGLDVVVLESAQRLLQRVTAPVISEFYQRIHQEEGVHIHTGVTIVELAGKHGQVSSVICADGVDYAADLVIIGVGVLPNVELAGQSGLDVANGILINELGQSSDPDIFAAGDCANYYDDRYQKRLRLESVPNAMEQAKCVAATLCGEPSPCQSLPWFWSDQYDLKLQIAGISDGYDQVILRGDATTARSFVAFYLRNGQLIAADCINRPQEFMLCKRILSGQCGVNLDLLADDAVPVKELIA